MGESAARTRVLWLIKGLGPGGAEQLLVSFAKVADHARFDFHAAYLVPWKTALVGDLTEAGVSVHHLGDDAAVGWRWPLRLRRLVRQQRIDVLHLHSPSVAAIARLVVLTLPRRHRPRLVSTEHNTWDSYGRVTRWLNAGTCWLDHARWAVSHRVLHSVWRPLRGRTSVLVHGLVLTDQASDAASSRRSLRREWGVSDGDVVMCTVANFRPNKAYPNLLHAAHQVVTQDARAYFVSVGQGPLEQQIRDLHQQLGLGDRFRLLGFRRDVDQVLAACDVFVLASEHEGFPIAVMEALAAGLPVVATDVGGVSDAVTPGREGLLVARGAPDALAAAVLELIRDHPRRLAMAAAARRRGGDFDISHAVRTVEAEYARQAATPPAAPVSAQGGTAPGTRG